MMGQVADFRPVDLSPNVGIFLISQAALAVTGLVE